MSHDVKIRQLQGALGGNRIVRGTVNGDGTIARGAGFTATNDATGEYTVTFDVEFEAIPTVVVCAEGAGAVTAKVGTATAEDFTVGTFTTTDGVNLDMNFDFVAIG